MLINIYMKFLEDILNRSQVTKRTRFCDRQRSKGKHSKNVNAIDIGLTVIEQKGIWYRQFQVK